MVEDGDVRLDEVKQRFGEEVALVVDGLTKLKKIGFANREDRQAESIRKMLLAMTGDIRVIIVKLADRLHNMRTIAAFRATAKSPLRRKRSISTAPSRTASAWAKSAANWRIWHFTRWNRKPRRNFCARSSQSAHEHEEWLRRIQKQIEEKLASEDVPARVEGRVKRAYSIYQKLKRQKISLDQVYDLLAVRIITDSVKNCYAALGVIHNEWHPIPGRIKDFIAMPRPNLYQSLHTSVIGPGGFAFEVQIRTAEMHRIAEEGIAAHWKYKEGSRGPGDEDQRIAWLRQLVEWQREMRDATDFMSTLKVDLYPEEVYTFTPRGRVVVLPRGASPIDFAYSIHTDVGHTCVGAKVNGTIKPLKYALAQWRRRRNPDAARPSAKQGLAGSCQNGSRPQ